MTEAYDGNAYDYFRDTLQSSKLRKDIAMPPKNTGNMELHTFTDPEADLDTLARWSLVVWAASQELATGLAIGEVASRMNEDADQPIPVGIGGQIIAAIVGGDAYDGVRKQDEPWAELMIALVPDDEA